MFLRFRSVFVELYLHSEIIRKRGIFTCHQMNLTLWRSNLTLSVALNGYLMRFLIKNLQVKWDVNLSPYYLTQAEGSNYIQLMIDSATHNVKYDIAY